LPDFNKNLVPKVNNTIGSGADKNRWRHHRFKPWQLWFPEMNHFPKKPSQIIDDS